MDITLMDITLTLNISVDHVDGTPYWTKEQIVAALTDAVADANPIMIGEDEGSPFYEVTIWDVEEA